MVLVFFSFTDVRYPGRWFCTIAVQHDSCKLGSDVELFEAAARRHAEERGYVVGLVTLIECRLRGDDLVVSPHESAPRRQPLSFAAK